LLKKNPVQIVIPSISYLTSQPLGVLSYPKATERPLMEGQDDVPLGCRQTRLFSQSKLFSAVPGHDELFLGEHNG